MNMPNRDPERIPPPESYRRWRRYLGWFALLSAVGLVYASLIPLNFYFQPLETAFSGFTHAPWLNLGIYKRADWVANALVVLPIGFAGTGAICLGRQAKLQHVFAVAFLVAAIMFLIAAIEFVQVWFPPRTVSLNDIAAGWLGSLLGPPLWLLAGGPLVNHLLRAQTTSDPDSRKASFCVWLLAAYLTCLCIWSLLPGDLILSKHELMVKYEAGRIAMVPGSELASATGSRDFLGKVISLFGSVVKLVPLGFLAFISKIEARKKICLLVCVPTALELLQLPVFSRHFSTSDVLLGWLGAWLGWCLAGQTDRLIALNRLLIVRYALLLLNVSVILVAFSFGATRLATAASRNSVDSILQLAIRTKLLRHPVQCRLQPVNESVSFPHTGSGTGKFDFEVCQITEALPPDTGLHAHPGRRIWIPAGVVANRADSLCPRCLRYICLCVWCNWRVPALGLV